LPCCPSSAFQQELHNAAMRPLLRLEDEQHFCAISGSYLWTTPYHPPSSGSVSAGALPDLEAHQLEQLTREREQREKLRRQESAAKRDTAKVADKKI
jgi:hypothetical protein